MTDFKRRLRANMKRAAVAPSYDQLADITDDEMLSVASTVFGTPMAYAAYVAVDLNGAVHLISTDEARDPSAIGYAAQAAEKRNEDDGL